MRINAKKGLLGVAIAGIVTLASAAPALAADTAATLTVSNGVLSISVPPNADLGTIASTVLGGTINGSLGQVQVNDARAAPAGSGWVATVISTAFTATGGTIGAASVGYTVGPITQVGTATYTANDPGNLTGVSAALTATGITGDNSATWNPTINVAVAGGKIAGTYSGTITHSVS